MGLQVKAEINSEQAELIGKLRTHPERVDVQHCLSKLFQRLATNIALDMLNLSQYAMLQVNVIVKPMAKEVLTEEIDAMPLEEAIIEVCRIGSRKLDQFADEVMKMATKRQPVDPAPLPAPQPMYYAPPCPPPQPHYGWPPAAAFPGTFGMNASAPSYGSDRQGFGRGKSFSSLKPCRDFVAGKCAYGAHCKFAHVAAAPAPGNDRQGVAPK